MKTLPDRMFKLALLLALTVVVTQVQRVEAQAWATNNPMQVARWSHTATLLANGTVLIAGGLIYNTNGNSADTSASELYNPATGNSSLTTSMQNGRQSHRATRLASGQVLISGGGGSSSEVYDPGTSSWINYASMNEERIVHTATLLPNGKVLAAGGYNDNSGQDLASAELYDPAAGTWSATAAMPYKADTFAAVLLTNGTVLVCGGSDAADGIYYETNAAIYYPATQTWTNTAPLNEARAGHTATLLPNGKVLVLGGNGGNTAEVYDPVAKTWSYAADLNDGWYQPNTVVLTNGQLLVEGDGNNDVEIYDPSADTWSYADSLPVAGNQQTATVLAGGQVLVTGGSGTQYNGPALATIEIYGSMTTMPTPTLTVTASPLSGLVALTVQFTSPSVDSSGNTVTNWNWNFGDGLTSAAQSPSHVYTNAGSFSPALTAYSSYGTTPLSVTGPGTITVTNLTLNATDTPQSGAAPLSVQFSSPGKDSGGYTVTNWNWSFGDGTTSSAQNPTHTYNGLGIFSPGLVAKSAHGSSPLIVTGLGAITVTNPPNPAFQILYTFTPAFGSGPSGSLALSGSTLYGTTSSGGVSNSGTLFAISTNGSGFTNLYGFNSTTNSSQKPKGIILSGGTLYGSSDFGGSRSGGTVFAVSTNGTGYTNLYGLNFNVDPNSPNSPQAPVVLAGNNLYGATWYGGSYNHGTLFSVATNGSSSSILHSFYTPTYNPYANNDDGLFPSAKLIFSGGTLYGTAENGGMNGGGTVFSVVTNQPGSFTVLHYFSTPLNVTNSDGANSFAGLVLSGGTLYGAASGGGGSGNGVIFAVNTDGSGFTNLYNFTGGADGSNPRGGLTLSGGTLYGTATAGGAYTNGTLFSVSTNGSGFKSLYSFTGGADGASPQADLILSGNVLYGTATAGGISGNGTVFSFALSSPRPQLAIARSGTNVVLTWSTSATGYGLQSSLRLGTAAVWGAVSPLPVIVNSLNTVTNPISATQKFYRLSQ